MASGFLRGHQCNRPPSWSVKPPFVRTQRNPAKIDDGAGSTTTLVGLVVAATLAVLLVVSPLIYVFVLADTNWVTSEPAADDDKRPDSDANDKFVV